MEKIIRGYIFRLYPTDNQKTQIEINIGTSRFIYNYFLNTTNKEKPNAYQYINQISKLQEIYPWLKEIDENIIKSSIYNLIDVYKKNKQPKFKNKEKSKKSFKINNTSNDIQLDLTNKTIKLPKLKTIKIRGYRNINKINGKIISATIYKEANKYYVSLSIEIPKNQQIIIPKTIIGLDLGIKNLIITSDGKTYNNKKYIEKYEKKLKGLQKSLARSQKGSKNREKIKQKIERTYQKLKNSRKYTIHEISKEITDNNDIIVTETLNIKEMVKSNLAKKIYDASWYELIKCIEYKSKWKNKKFYQVPTNYPSSQICSRCSYQNKNLKDLSIRNWECPKCTCKHDRDINASINIMTEGIKQYMKEL